MKKVKILRAADALKLEELINEWMKDNYDREIIDIKYQVTYNGTYLSHFCLMVHNYVHPRGENS